MKTPSDDIYQLIRAMSPAEKRYFKIHFSSEKSLVTDLFNYLNSMDEYNEKEVKDYFKKTKLSKNLKVYKIMLMELLLKSLSSFRYKKNVTSLIRQNIEEVEILVEKNLFSLAYKKLQKAKKLSLKHEEYDQLISIIDWEYQFEVFFEINDSNKGLELLDEIIAASKTTTDILKAKKSTHEVSLLAVSISETLTSTKQIKEYEIEHLNTLKKLRENISSKNFKQLFYAHSSLGHLYHSTQENEKEYKHKKAILDFFKKHKYFIESNLKKYWSSTFNFANCCLRSGRQQEFIEALDILKSIGNKNLIFQKKLENVHSMELAFHRRNKNFNYIIEKLEPITLQNINQLDQEKRKSSIFSYITLMMTYLSLGNHDKVQFYLNKLFKNKKMGKEFTYFYEAIELINHFEKGEKTLLQNLLDSKKRKIKREPNYGSPFFKILLNFFVQISKHNNDIHKSINQLKDKVSKNSDDRFLNLLKYFLLDDWLHALENNKTYSEHILQKN